MSQRKTSKVDFVEQFHPCRITGIEIGAEDDDGPYLSVEFTMPVPGFAYHATMTEIFYLKRTRNARLNEAVNHLHEVITEAIKEGDNVSFEPCDECTANCCTEWAKDIYVTPEDVERICEGKDKAFLAKHFRKMTVENPTFFGRVETVFHKDGKEYCSFYNFEKRNCSIHKKKPIVCRDFLPYYCDHYEKADEELIQLRRKR